MFVKHLTYLPLDICFGGWQILVDLSQIAYSSMKLSKSKIAVYRARSLISATIFFFIFQFRLFSNHLYYYKHDKTKHFSSLICIFITNYGGNSTNLMIHGFVQTIFKMSPVGKYRIFHISTSIHDSFLYWPLNAYAFWGTTHHKHV